MLWQQIFSILFQLSTTYFYNLWHSKIKRKNILQNFFHLINYTFRNSQSFSALFLLSNHPFLSTSNCSFRTEHCDEIPHLPAHSTPISKKKNQIFHFTFIRARFMRCQVQWTDKNSQSSNVDRDCPNEGPRYTLSVITEQLPKPGSIFYTHRVSNEVRLLFYAHNNDRRRLDGKITPRW